MYRDGTCIEMAHVQDGTCIEMAHVQRWHMYNEIHRDDTHSVICTKMAHALYRDGSHWQLGLVLKSVKCSTCADMAHP